MDCPLCGHKEEEEADFDIGGNSVYICEECGAKWAAVEGSPLLLEE